MSDETRKQHRLIAATNEALELVRNDFKGGKWETRMVPHPTAGYLRPVAVWVPDKSAALKE